MRHENSFINSMMPHNTWFVCVVFVSSCVSFSTPKITTKHRLFQVPTETTPNPTPFFFNISIISPSINFFPSHSINVFHWHTKSLANPTPFLPPTMASTLSQVFRDNPLPLNHIIPLDFTSVHSLPESHVWPAFDGFPFGTTYPGEKFSIPIIDLMDPNAAQLVGHACEKWGAFQLTSHGLPSILTDDVESQTRRLFALPAHEKMKALRLPSGGTGYGQARISPFYPKFMWHEGFTIMGSAVDHARKLWPDDYKGFW